MLESQIENVFPPKTETFLHFYFMSIRNSKTFYYCLFSPFYFTIIVNVSESVNVKTEVGLVERFYIKKIKIVEYVGERGDKEEYPIITIVISMVG